MQKVAAFMGEEMSDLLYYLRGLLESWQSKAVVASGLTFVDQVLDSMGIHFREVSNLYVTSFGGDFFLLELLFWLMCLDLVTGLVAAKVKKTVKFSVFTRGIRKYPLYAIYIFLTGAAAAGINRSFDYASPLLNLFVSYLLATECFSIILNLEKLGFKVPPLLSYIVKGFKVKAETTIKDKLKSEEPPKYGRRKTDVPGTTIAPEISSAPEVTPAPVDNPDIPSEEPFIPGDNQHGN